MAGFDTHRVYVVNRQSAAWTAFQKICASPVKPGRIIPLTAEEFKAFRRDVMLLEIPE